jgi:cytochrome c2
MSQFKHVHLRLALVGFFLVLSLIACEPLDERTGAQPVRGVPGGNVENGRELLSAWGCGACHRIPGVVGADALVGPPLDAWSERQFIAGTLENSPDNLIYWIMHPQEVEPGTAMPDTNVPESAARDMAAYLYTLEP